MSNEPIEGQILDSMPATQPGTSQHMATTANPFERMALVAMDTGRVDQLDKLLDLQMRWDAEQQRKAFVAAMSDFKAEAGGITIAKSKRVSFSTSKGKTEYDHAELHDITRALVPVMAKYGLSHSWKVTQEGSAITVDCVVSHRDGHREKVTMTAPPDDSGGKNTIQAIASAKSYLERYTFLAATGMATGGEIDNDGRDPAPQVVYISEEQEIVLRDLVDAYVNKKDKFLEWISGRVGFTVTKLMEIPASSYDVVHAQLQKLAQEKRDAS